MSESVITIEAFEFTSTGVVCHDDNAPYDDWAKAVGFAWACRIWQFWMGDLINYGESRYGEKYTQAMDATGYAYQTLANVAYVANAIPGSRRRELVPFSHHAEVAALPAEQQAAWLEACEANELTVAELRHKIKLAEPTSMPQQLWCVVSCHDAADQTHLHNRMIAEGRAVKLKVTTNGES